MRKLISGIWDVLVTKIGRCTRCMQQSLTVALAAWGAFIIGLVIWPHSIGHNLAGIVAIGLTALWALHVGVYATRVVKAPTEPKISREGRRRALFVLLRAGGAGVVASVPSLLWTTEAFAFCGQCTVNADCGVGWCCKNTAPVNAGYVCNECKRC